MRLALLLVVRPLVWIENVQVRDLHTRFANHASMNRAHVPVVALLFGHSNVCMTMRYAHAAPRDAQAAAERIGKTLGRFRKIRSRATNTRPMPAPVPTTERSFRKKPADRTMTGVYPKLATGRQRIP